MNEVFAFECTVKGRDWQETINARNAGKAKYIYWRNVRDAWEDVPFTAIRCRKMGKPASSWQFTSNARYRGLPDARCGDRVRVGDAAGVIVGHDSSANFLILFDDDSVKYPGMTMSVHPQGLTMNPINS